MPSHPLRRAGSCLVLTACAVLACQSAEEYRDEADEEVYALVQARRAELFGDALPFTIEPAADSLRQRLLRGEAAIVGPLSLLDCLEIAAENSRDYQDQRESLYLTALDLTLAQWEFRTHWDATLSGSVTGDGEGAQRAEMAGAVILERMLGTGMQIVSSLGSSLFRLLSTGDGWDALSSIGLSVTQPLLRGSSPEIVLEPLTAAQRDLVYEVRAYERFRRTFAVDVATRYFRVIQAMDALENERQNAAALTDLRVRNEALAAAGRVNDIELDQARQDELRSENRLIELEQGLQAQLDDFNFFLGLPVETPIELDPTEVERQSVDVEQPPPAVAAEDALSRYALDHRLDYANTEGQVRDAERQIRIAADALRAGLDLEASVNATSEEGRPAGFRSANLPWSAGFTLDLPVDQLPERNVYRASLVALEAAWRGLESLGDSIRSSLRDSMRQVQTNQEQYVLQLDAVVLAERRVLSASLNLQAGRSSTRDVLEAQSDLLTAQNALTAARIDLLLAWLSFFNQLELLTVDETGIVLDNGALQPLLSEGA